jgi:hypothetical protein
MIGKYIAILAVIIMALVVLVLGRDLWTPARTGTTGESVPSSLAEKNRVAVSHAFKDDVHRYTGTFLLPHSCFSVDQLATYDGEKIKVSFTVKDILATEKTCMKIKTRYPFSLIVEAPEGTPAVFFLNNEEVPSQIRELEWQSAAGTLIDNTVTTFPTP